MTNLLALQSGTELVRDYRIERVLGAGGFGITYLAEEIALARKVTIKEYFPSDFAARETGSSVACPRSHGSQEDYTWGLERFIEEAKALAKFDHPHIVRVYRYFRANKTAYMVLHFEEGQSLKAWLAGLGRAPRQNELDDLIGPLLDALEVIHAADFLHRDIAPDNIMVRDSGSPVLIDFGSARGDIAKHSKTVSALVKAGYSPYEQYAATGRRQGPWTDIYSLAATLYQAVTGKRPTDSPTRMVADDLVPAREAALSSYRPEFLAAIDQALSLKVEKRPQSVALWREQLFANRVKPQPRAADARPRQAPVMPPDVPSMPPDVPAPLPAKDEAKRRKRGLRWLLDEARPGAGKSVAAPVPAAEFVQSAPAKPVKPSAGTASETSDDAVTPAGQKPPQKKVRKEQRPKKRGWFGGGKPKAAKKPKKPAAAKAKSQPTPKAKAASLKAKKPALGKKRPIPAAAKIAKAPNRRGRAVAAMLFLGLGLASAVALYFDVGSRVVKQRGTSTVSSQTTDVALTTVLSGHNGSVGAVRFSRNGQWIVSTGADGTLRVWDAPEGRLIRTLEMDDGAATALAVFGPRALTGHYEGELVLWDLELGSKLATYKRNSANIWSVAFAGEANRFAASSHDWSVALWDTRTQAAPVHVFLGHKNAAQAVAYSPHGPLIASGGADKKVKLWHAGSFKLLRTYSGARDFVTAVAFSPNGRLLAAGSLDGSVRIWRTSSGRVYRVLKGARGRVGSVAFSPDGRRIAAAGRDGKVRIWQVQRSRRAFTLSGHAGPVNSVAFSPNGRRLVSAGEDGKVRIWNAVGGG